MHGWKPLIISLMLLVCFTAFRAWRAIDFDIALHALDISNVPAMPIQFN